MSSKPLGSSHRADRAARLEAYKAARDEGLDTFGAAGRAGIISETARAGYERWYRRVTGQPPREPQVLWSAPQGACDAEWRMPS